MRLSYDDVTTAVEVGRVACTYSLVRNKAVTIVAGCLIEVRSVRQSSDVMLTHSNRVRSSIQSQHGGLLVAIVLPEGESVGLPNACAR